MILAHLDRWLSLLLSFAGISVFILALFATEVVRLRSARRRKARDKIKRMSQETWIEDLWEDA